MGVFMAGLLSAGVAQAADPLADLPAVQQLLVAGESRDALKQLQQIEKSLARADGVVPQASLATIWLYRGIAEHQLGGKKGRDLDAWRQALAVHNEANLDATLIESNDVLGLFEALRGEVRSRGSLDVGVPEAVGAARLYVDGVRLSAGDTIIPGTHLAQITCPDDQGTFSVVTDFERPLDWLALCPDGVDTSVAPPEDDEWAAFGPAFGTPGETDPPEGDPTTPVTVVTPPDPEQVDPGAGDGQRRVLGVSLLTSGGALLVGGVVVNFAVVAPTYADIEYARVYPNTLSRTEADALTARFNVSRAAALGMMGGGAVLLGTGFLVDAPLLPQVGWNYLGVAGRF